MNSPKGVARENKSKDNYDMTMWVGSVSEVWNKLVGFGESNVVAMLMSAVHSVGDCSRQPLNG